MNKLLLPLQIDDNITFDINPSTSYEINTQIRSKQGLVYEYASGSKSANLKSKCSF